MNEPPTATPALSPATRPRAFHIPKKLWALGVLVALGLGGWWYVKAPDLPPGGPLALLPDLGRVTSSLPIVGSAGRKTNPPLQGERAIHDAALATVTNSAEAKAEAQVRQTLAATGLSITAVDFTTTPGGQTALIVGLDVSKLAKSGAFDPGLASGVDGVVKLVKSKNLDLSAAQQVVIAVADSEGRPLFGIAAPSSAVMQFRDGKISQRDFLKATAIKAESRAAIIDAARGLASK